jgi:hypothetical protein
MRGASVCGSTSPARRRRRGRRRRDGRTAHCTAAPSARFSATYELERFSIRLQHPPLSSPGSAERPGKHRHTAWMDAVRPSTARFARAQDEELLEMPSRAYLRVRSVPAIPGTPALGGRPSGDGRVSNHVPRRGNAILAQPRSSARGSSQCASQSWQYPADGSPAQVACSARLVASVASAAAASQAKRTQQSPGVRR